VSPIEIVAVVLGIANVTLVVLRSMWNYPFGLAMVALYAVIFYETRLYSDALLQLFFFVVQLYGWWAWSRARADAGEIRVELLDGRARLVWLAGIAVATAGWGWLMHRYTDAALPWWDAAVAMLSVAAQILQSRRKLESWWLWIATDLVAIPLYAAKGLGLTAGLYLVFLVLASWGAIDWARVRHRALAAAATA
jgi:nicotinamide mononucleotide transporter